MNNVSNYICMMLEASNRKTTRQDVDGAGEMKKTDIHHVREETRQWKTIASWPCIICVILIAVAVVWFLS